MPSSPESEGLARGGDWAAILDEFEQQLARVDILTAELSEAGIVLPLVGFPDLSASPGPIPDSMRERAATVLNAQREAMSRLERLRAELSKHIGVTRAVAPRPDVAVYLDRSA